MEPDPDEHLHPGKEDLRWGPGVQREKVEGSTPLPGYTKIAETARRWINPETQCAMFCGGKNCKYCTTDHWQPSQMAIEGLYSSWVTENILAMARPSNYGIDNYGFLEQFEKNGIKTVINLQEPGEHGSCGYGNDISGFSYNPQRFMERDIYFYNFAWHDFGVAPMATMLDIVKVMQFAVSVGKVAVHCHAGLGRTGLLIACYLVFNNRIKAGDAVHYVRSRRPGAIQTSQQVEAVLDFEKHLLPFRIIFPSKIQGGQEVSFRCFLNRQSHTLHGYEARRLKHIPKVLYICCERQLELAGCGNILRNVQNSPQNIRQSFTSKPTSTIHAAASCHRIALKSPDNIHGVVHVDPTRRLSLSFEDLTNKKFKKVLTTDGYNSDNSSQDSEVDVTSKREICSSEACSSIHSHSAESLSSEQMQDKRENKVCDNLLSIPGQGKMEYVFHNSFSSSSYEICSKVSGCSNEMQDTVEYQLCDSFPSAQMQDKTQDSVQQSDCPPGAGRVQVTTVNEGKGKKKILKDLLTRFQGKDENRQAKVIKNDSEGTTSTVRVSDSESQAQEVSLDVKGFSVLNTTLVCESLAKTEYTSYVRDRADYIETQLNLTDEAWSMLAFEDNPDVLSAVLWDWLDQLKEPLLSRQDLNILFEKQGSPINVLNHLERCTKHFLEYLAFVVFKIFPQEKELEITILERLLSHLTHQYVMTQLKSFTHNRDRHQHWSDMQRHESSCLLHFFFELINEITICEKIQAAHR